MIGLTIIFIITILISTVIVYRKNRYDHDFSARRDRWKKRGMK